MKYFKQNLVTTLPAIFVSLFLFISIYFLFGVSQVILVSFLTLLFQVRRAYDFSFSALLRIDIMMLILCSLAYATSLHLGLRLLLNFLVPFLIVNFLTDKFNPKSYFIYGMEFVFLQLLPITREQFFIRIAALIYGFCFLMAVLRIYSYQIQKQRHYNTVRKGFFNLANQLKKLAWLEDIASEQKELRRFMHSITSIIYSCRNYQCLAAGYGRIYYYFLLIFQRFLYYMNEISSKDHVRTFENQPYYLRLGMLFQRIAKQMNLQDNHSLIEEIQEFQQKRHLCSKAEEEAMSELLNLLCFTLEKMTERKADNPEKRQQAIVTPVSKRFFRFFRAKPFQTRFALRLSAVLCISFSFCYITDLEFCYWYPMSTFLMLIPYAEENLMKVNNRVLGTITGFLIISVLITVFPSLRGHLLIIVIMTCLMHSVPVTSWTMPLYSTCYGITLTTLSFSQERAFSLCLFYIGLAVFTTLLANHFLLPNTVKSEFKKSIKELFSIDEAILHEIEKGAKSDPDILRGLLAHSALLSDKILRYMQNHLNQEEQEFYDQLLPLNQQMISEMEQLHACIQTQYPFISPEHDLLFDELIYNLKESLKRIQSSFTSNELTSFMRTDQPFKAFGRLEDELYFNTLAINCMNAVNQLEL